MNDNEKSALNYGVRFSMTLYETRELRLQKQIEKH